MQDTKNKQQKRRQQALSALKHYEQISDQAMHWNGVVVKALQEYGDITDKEYQDKVLNIDE